MAEHKQSKLIIYIMAGLVCLFLGILSANFAKTHTRYEEFNASEIDTQECPSELTEAQCLTYPIYNANASGGFEGYPIVSGQYYCTDSNTCYTVKSSTILGNITFHTLNQLIFSLFYFLIFLIYLWIRNRIRRNLTKTENPVT